MPPIVAILLWCVALVAAGFLIKKTAKFLERKTPRLISAGLTVFTYVCVGLFLLTIPLGAFFILDSVFSVDRIRHYFSDKRHPITQEQIIDKLGFEYNQDLPNEEHIAELVKNASAVFDEDSQHYIDSLFLDFTYNHSFRSGANLQVLAASYDFPVEISSYMVCEMIPLAKTKYQVLNTILAYYYHIKDYDKVMSVYDLAKSWKWDRDIGRGSLKDRHNADRNTVLSNSMQLATQILEERYQPVTDSVARVILKHCVKGLKADYTNEFFWDRRAQYAYQIRHPKADKYADGFLGRARRWDGLFAKDFDYAIYDRGGEIQGYQDRFFTDPLFLRYKSCLKQHKYKKAKQMNDYKNIELYTKELERLCVKLEDIDKKSRRN